MDKRGQAHGVRAFAVHPGTIGTTNSSRYLTDDDYRGMGLLDEQGKRITPAFDNEFKSIPEGAATMVWCATSPQLTGKGGVYCENSDIADMTETPFTPGVFAWAVNAESADRLWQVSEQLVGLKFSI
jgi:NAD(P)-dependent dehydrogenase (short-subunit alcohol dehydrogenase family)